MSNKLRPRQFADRKGGIVEDFDGNILVGMGAAIPVDGTPGYSAGGDFFVRQGAVGAAHYINEGSVASCAFKPFGPQAGFRVARGQFTTVTASDTIATGLATVVSVVANLDSAPAVDPETATASIGDQAGAPAAGSILIQTWKTFGGTPAAATTFAKKVNWIAFGT